MKNTTKFQSTFRCYKDTKNDKEL